MSNSEFMEGLVSLKEIINSIDKLKVNKATGLDGVKSEFLIFGNNSSLVVVLSLLFSGMFVLGIMPPDFNVSVKTPIPKVKNAGLDPSNFRPISISFTILLFLTECL